MIQCTILAKIQIALITPILKSEEMYPYAFHQTDVLLFFLYFGPNYTF